jgi:perosamine synthetase
MGKNIMIKLDSFIPLMVPNILEEDVRAVSSVLLSGMLVQGDKVEQLEKEIANYLNVKHAIAVTNGTASLHMTLVAMGIGAGDEVIVPALSYIATVNVVELVGAKPVFVDVDLKTFNIDFTKIEEAITPLTKVIIPVHEFGLVADINEVITIADKHNLYVIEDAACALGATDNKKYAGSFGNAGSFSFHPRKAITSGEGGMVVTNDDDLASKLRALRNHGIEMQNGKMEFILPGFNYRMTDFQAALLSSQFKRFEAILSYKDELANVYKQCIDNDKIKVPVVPIGKKHSWQTFHIIIDDVVNRDNVIIELKKKNIGTNYGAQCLPNEQYYKKQYNLNCDKLFPNAMVAYKQGLGLPLYEKLTHEQIEDISKILNNII